MADQQPEQTTEQTPTEKKPPKKKAIKKKQPKVEVLPAQPQQDHTKDLENGVNPEMALSTLEQKSYQDIVAQIEKTIPQIFNEAQRALLLNETPRYKIKRRQGKGGQVFDYVDVGYVIEQINILTGFRWSFQQLTKTDEKEYMEFSLANKFFKVRGRLIVHTKDGDIFQDDTGGAEIKEKRAGGWLDVPSDEKAAWSDCLKRCARKWGIALDVYSGAIKRRQDAEHPEAPITEGQRRRLEVLAFEAKLGHAGLKKLIADMFDYSSTTQIQRRHFEQIQAELENQADVVATEEIPDEIKKGFDILGTPPAKQKALYKAYEKQGKLDELKSKISMKVDAKNNPEAGKPSGNKPKGG